MSRDLYLKLTIAADGSQSVQVVKQVEQAVKDTQGAVSRGASAQREATKSVDEFVQSLQRELLALQSSKQALREIEAASRGATAAQLEQVRALGQNIDALQRSGNATLSVLGQLGSFVAPVAVLATIREIANTLLEARLQVEKLQATQLFANDGNTIKAARDIEFAKNKANELGLELIAVSNSWGKYQAAVKTSNIAQEDARQLFDAILKASATLRLSSVETEGSLLAVTQMISKGNVQAEELRGQLGERLPGAFAIAARAMGVTERELNKMLETGQVLSADFLPKFGAQLLKELGDAPTQAAAGTQAAVNRVANAWTEFKQAIAEGLNFKPALEATAGFFNFFTENVRAGRAQVAKLKEDLSMLPAWLRPAAEFGAGVAARAFAPEAEREAAARAAWLKKQEEDIAKLEALGARRSANDTFWLEKKKAEVAEQRRLQAEQAKLAEKEIADNQSALDRRLANQKQTAAAADAAMQRERAYLKELAESGDKKAKWQLAQKEIDEKFARDLASGVRTLAEIEALKASEFKKIFGGDGRKATEAIYRERIAAEESYQARVKQTLADDLASLKKQLDAKLISEDAYYDAVAQRRTIALAEERESVNRQLALARDAVTRGDAAKKADVAKYLGEEQAFSQKRIDIANDTADAIDAINQRETLKYISELLKRTAAHDRAASAFVEKTADMIAAMNEEADQRRFEMELIGQTEIAQSRLTVVRDAEVRQRKLMSEALKDYNKELEKAQSQEERDAARSNYEQRVRVINQTTAAQKELGLALVETRENARVAGEAFDEFWDAVVVRGESAGKTFQNIAKRLIFDWLKQQLKQQFVLNIVPQMGAGGGGLSGFLGSLLGGATGGGGGGGLGSLFGSAGGLFSMLGTAAANMGWGALPFVAGAGPIAAGSGLAGFLGAAGGGFMAGIGTLGTALTSGIAAAGGLATVLGSMIPVIGPLIAIGSMFIGKNKDGVWFDIGDQYASKARDPRNVVTTALGSVTKVGEPDPATVAPFFAQMQNLAQNFVDIFGEETAARARAAIGEWTGYSQRGRGTEYEDAAGLQRALATESKDVMAEFFSRAFSAIEGPFAQVISTWSGSTEELTKYIQGLLAAQSSLTQQGPLLKSIIGEAVSLQQLDTIKNEGENLTDTLNRVITAFSVTNAIAEMMGKSAEDAFGKVGLESLAARERLISLSGGLQSLSQGVQFYYENFFTEEERKLREREAAQKQVNAVFDEFGIAVPRTRDEFRSLVSGLDVTTDKGARLFAALMRIAPAFTLLTDTVTGTTAAVERSDEYLRNFFTEEERANMRRAQSAAEVNRVFSELNLTVPETRDAFRQLIEAQDLTTEHGRLVYNALMAIAGSFANVTQQAEQTTQAVQTLGDTMGELISQIRSEATDRIGDVESIIGSTTQGATAQLAARERYLRDMLSTLGPNSAARQPFEQALAQVTYLQQVLARAAAAAPGFADAMFDLQLQYEQRISLAQGNAQLLQLIEADYQRRRLEIITQGTSSGLTTLRNQFREWLDGLMLNDQLTTLTPEQRLAEAERQYRTALGTNDASQITSAADAYLRIAREFFASGAGYQAIFSAVTGQIGILAGGGAVSVTAPVVGTGSSTLPTASTSAGNAAAAAAAASAAATQANSALATIMNSVASISAEIKYSVDREGAATRQNDNLNVERLERAIAAPGLVRVEP